MHREQIYQKKLWEPKLFILQPSDPVISVTYLLHALSSEFTLLQTGLDFIWMDTRTQTISNGAQLIHIFNTLRTGDADLRFYINNCARRKTQICVFNTRLFSVHSTLNYAIHRACLWMVLLTDVYRNLTSLWINL